jgi:hypothetical protein
MLNPPLAVASIRDGETSATESRGRLRGIAPLVTDVRPCRRKKSAGSRKPRRANFGTLRKMPWTKIAMPTTPVAFLVKGPHRGTTVQCPFHDGAATLDLLLAEIDLRDTELFDAALDLRTLAVAREDAAACVAQLFRVRRLLAGRHYLAFYRVRSWAKRALHIEVRGHRGEAWRPCDLAIDCARVGEAVNAALATMAENDTMPAGTDARFVFSSE